MRQAAFMRPSPGGAVRQFATQRNQDPINPESRARPPGHETRHRRRPITIGSAVHVEIRYRCDAERQSARSEEANIQLTFLNLPISTIHSCFYQLGKLT